MQYQKIKVCPALLRAESIIKAEIAGRYVADRGLLASQGVQEPRVFKMEELKIAAFDPLANVIFFVVPDSLGRVIFEVSLDKYLRTSGKSIAELDSRLQPQEVEIFVADQKQNESKEE